MREGEHIKTCRLKGKMDARDNTKKRSLTHQFVVLILDFQAGGDAVAGVQEGLSLGAVCDVVQEHPRHVHTHKHDGVGHKLKHNDLYIH